MTKPSYAMVPAGWGRKRENEKQAVTDCALLLAVHQPIGAAILCDVCPTFYDHRRLPTELSTIKCPFCIGDRIEAHSAVFCVCLSIHVRDYSTRVSVHFYFLFILYLFHTTAHFMVISLTHSY